MGKATFRLGNGMTIDAENPENHGTPEICKKCDVLHYFGGHFCTADPSKAFKRGQYGYFDGQ